MPPPRGGESKQGLIITLVFFILLSIILGVFVYLGYAGQDEPLAKAKKAEEEKKNIDSDRNWQKFKALLYQAYMGHTPKDLDDLTALRTSYDAKTLGKGSKDYDEVAKLVELLDKNLGWNAAQKKPARTYLDQIKRLEAELKKTQDDLADRDEKIATQAKKINELNGQLTQARADYQTKLNEVKTNLNKDLGTLVNANNQQRKDFGDYAKDREALELKFKQYQEMVAKQMKKKDDDIRGLKRQLDKVLEESARTHVNVVEYNRPRGRITLIDRTGEQPYINLGSADHVKPQLTFAIHGQNLDGTPAKTAKGSLEVVYVVGEHLSQCRITELKDANRDPVVKGDFLFNPFWDPNRRQHVAIAGIIDLFGTARRERPAELNRLLMEFKRNLEHQGIIVDAWLDLASLEEKGEITRQTDFLILGEGFGSGKGRVAKEGDAPSSREAKLGKVMDDMEREALLKGVTVVQLHKFLAMSGYKAPRGLTRDRGDLFDSERPPEEPKEPPKKDGDRPKDGNKGEKKG